MANEAMQSARVAFPRVLYDMLEEVSDDPKLAEIVSWMPHGRAFKVHNPGRFEQEIMPSYFVERYDSFRFLLERWAFQGLRKGKDRGAYYNLKFVRGMRDQIVDVSKEDMFAAMPDYLSPRDEPDFYSMPPALSSLSGAGPKIEASESNSNSKSNSDKADNKSKSSTPKSSSGGSNSSRSNEEEEQIAAGVAIDKGKGSKKRSRSKTPSRESNKRARSRSSQADRKASNSSTDSDEITSEAGSSPILLAPTDAIFSGFKLPCERVHVEILKSTDDFAGRGIEPFIHKRPMRTLGEL